MMLRTIIGAVGCARTALLLAVPHAIGQPADTKQPQAVVQRYCRLDADGARLTAEGRKQLAELVRSFEDDMPREIDIISTVSASGQTMLNERQALVRVASTHVGFLNVATAKLTQEAPGLHHWGDVAVSFSDGAWRIDGPMPLAFVGVKAAIRHVAELRKTTTDATIRRNADRTLAALRRMPNRLGARHFR